MSARDDEEEYTCLFLKFSDRVETWLRRALIFTLVLVVMFQAALSIPEIRQMISSAERHEGFPVQLPVNK